MPEPCPACAETHAVYRDFDDRPWRWLCVVECSQTCFKGPHPATHARLTATGAVERFVCDKHGVPEDEREGADKPPVYVTPGEKPKRAKKAVAPPPPVPKPPPPPTALARKRAEVLACKLLIYCTGCKARVPVRILNVIQKADGKFEFECPECWSTGDVITVPAELSLAEIEAEHGSASR